MLNFKKKENERSLKLLSGFKTFSIADRAVEDEKMSFNFISSTIKKSGEKERNIYFIFFGLSSICLIFSIISNPIFLLGIPLSIFFLYFYIKRKTIQRIEDFEKDYSAFLVSLSSAIRTGLDSFAALGRCAALFSPSSELHKEITKIQKKLELGTSEEEAIESFGKEIEHPDVPLFRTAFTYSRSEGSSLSDCLQRLAKVTRQRQSFRRKIKSALVLQRISAIGICVCAFVILGFQYFTNPEGMKVALAHPIGFKALSVGLSLVAIGLLWMLNLSRKRI